MPNTSYLPFLRSTLTLITNQIIEPLVLVDVQCNVHSLVGLPCLHLMPVLWIPYFTCSLSILDLPL